MSAFGVERVRTDVKGVGSVRMTCRHAGRCVMCSSFRAMVVTVILFLMFAGLFSRCRGGVTGGGGAFSLDDC